MSLDDEDIGPSRPDCLSRTTFSLRDDDADHRIEAALMSHAKNEKLRFLTQGTRGVALRARDPNGHHAVPSVDAVSIFAVSPRGRVFRLIAQPASAPERLAVCGCPPKAAPPSRGRRDVELTGDTFWGGDKRVPVTERDVVATYPQCAE